MGGRLDGPICEEVSLVLGQVVTVREHADLLALLRYEEALEAFTLANYGGSGRGGAEPVLEDEDPFGYTGFDFDSP